MRIRSDKTESDCGH